MAVRKRILVACEELILSGGMLRFERLGRALSAAEYELAYVCLADHPVAHWPSHFPVLSFTECAVQRWDFVMVPGAGFSDQTIERLARFRDPRFGRRIQHVLNDQSMKPRFLHVNRTFQPHLVIFNNLAWPPGTYTQFHAERFHTVLGAVDIDRFHPTDERPREQNGSIVLGGLANKNAEVLVDALALLPNNVGLKLLGNTDALLDARPDVRRMPHIERVGVLFEDELPSFYRNIDHRRAHGDARRMVEFRRRGHGKRCAADLHAARDNGIRPGWGDGRGAWVRPRLRRLLPLWRNS